MSERPIQVGDLVVVVRWSSCKCGIGHISKLVPGEKIGLTESCYLCGRIGTYPMIAACLLESDWVVPLSWLKRIPPLSELEVERTQEPTTERV